MKTGIRFLMVIAITSTPLVATTAAAKGARDRISDSAPAPMGEDSGTDPLMVAAREEMAASNRHDLAGFLRMFTKDAVILADAPPYSYRSKAGLTDFFDRSLLGSVVQYTIKPGAPQTEDRVGDHAYLEMAVNVRATDGKGDSFNDPIRWIGVLVHLGGVWKLEGLTLTTAGG